jgi:tetratricopeptide (TPR) repeat protein
MSQQAVDADPDNAAYRDSLGWVLFQQGEADAAIRELETAVELSRGADGQIDEADGVILDHLGDAHLRAGNVDHALRYWQLALRDLEKNEPQRADVTRKKIQQHSKE